MNPIQPLPERTTSLLRSSVVISSLPCVLSELVQNSLDARASLIRLTVDLDRWTLACHDDGHGIPPTQLQPLGKERYMGSKLGGGSTRARRARGPRGAPSQADSRPEIGLDEVETFGFRGEALSSLADIGLLEVVTRTADGGTHELIVSEGKTITCAAARAEREGIGTSVWVRDIFARVSLITLICFAA